MSELLGIALLFGTPVVLLVGWTFFPAGLWMAALMSGVGGNPISFALTLVAMRMRGVPQASIVMPMIQGAKAGVVLDLDLLEAHYLANGDVAGVVNALVAAQKAHISLDFEQAAAIDLAGRDVFEAVAMSVRPKVIRTPKVAAMCRDGIQLKATAIVTVRIRIDKLVGGAGEETILARVGEGICTTIGSAESHLQILENPDSISRAIAEKGLDNNTAFEIVSIDIADIDMGKNIGAERDIERAEADMRIAEARASERMSMAEAHTQEMVAYEQEMSARVVEAQARVPEALADTLRRGDLRWLEAEAPER